MGRNEPSKIGVRGRVALWPRELRQLVVDTELVAWSLKDDSLLSREAWH